MWRANWNLAVIHYNLLTSPPALFEVVVWKVAMSCLWRNRSFKSDLFSESVDLTPSDWFSNQTGVQLTWVYCAFFNCMLNYNQYIFKRGLLSYDLKKTWWQIFCLVSVLLYHEAWNVVLVIRNLRVLNLLCTVFPILSRLIIEP